MYGSSNLLVSQSQTSLHYLFLTDFFGPSAPISLDTFKADRFKSMCGIDGINRVLASIDATVTARDLELKINTVVIRGWNDDGKL